MSIPLAALEAVVDASGVAPAIEKLLPASVRHRQLTARTLLTGMMLTLDDGRPAQLTRVHAALTGLAEADQIRLGVIAQRETGPHQLTYRQAGHTHRLTRKLGPGGRAAANLGLSGGKAGGWRWLSRRGVARVRGRRRLRGCGEGFVVKRRVLRRPPAG